MGRERGTLLLSSITDLTTVVVCSTTGSLSGGTYVSSCGGGAALENTGEERSDEVVETWDRGRAEENEREGIIHTA